MQKRDIWVFIESKPNAPIHVRAFWHNAFLEKQDCLIFVHGSYRYHVLVHTGEMGFNIQEVKRLLRNYREIYLAESETQ